MKKTTLLLLLMNIVWAGTYPATKYLMVDTPFFLVTSLRYLIALAPLLIFAWLRHGLRFNLGDLTRTALIGISTFTLCPALMYYGVSLSRAGDAAVLTSAEPLLVSVGAYFYLRERIGRRTGVSLIVAFGGTLLLSEFWRAGTGEINPLGVFIILGGVFFEAVYSVLGKEVLRRHAPLQITAMALLCGSAVNAIVLTAMDWWPMAANIHGAQWPVLIVYLALICTSVGYTVWFVALREDSTAKVAVTIFTQPAFGILFSWLWVDEIPTAAQLTGAAVILFAVGLAVIRRKPAPLNDLPPPLG